MHPGAWTIGPGGGVSSVTPLRPRYGPSDVATLLWRRRALMGAVFAAVLLLGLLATLQLHKTYTAESSLLIRLGREYVYNPRVGDAGRGATPQTDDVIQSEMEILGSTEVKAKVLRDVGLARLYPELGRAFERARTPQAQAAVQGEALRRLSAGLKSSAAPDTSIVRLSFTARDPKMAATVLNTLVDEYLRQRRSVLLARDVGPLADQRRGFEARLAQADKAYTDFLAANGIGDFDSEKASLGQLYGQLLGDSYSARASLSETQGRLAATQAEVARAPAEISLYRDLDHSGADKLASLRVELQDLQARYKPDSQPVRDKQAQVDAMARLAAAQADATGSARRGANPVLQSLQSERDTLAAQVQSLRARAATLDGELARVADRRRRMAEIEPQYQALVRDRDLLSANVKNFAAREQESQAAQSLAQAGGDDSVRVVQRAYTPTKGASGRLPAALASGLFAAFAALCAGLAAAFSTRGFPSAASVERTLDLPVLAVATRKAAA